MSKSSLPPPLRKTLESALPRRDFLRLSAALSVLAACGSRIRSSDASLFSTLPNLKGHGKRVIVLGGGPAGLCAAYELDKMGFNVVVLEKTKRISGRVWTDYDFFEDGQYCELGATRLPDYHDLTMGYVKTLDLELAGLDHGDGDNTLYHLDGITRFKKPGHDQKPWPEERAAIESGYTAEIFKLMQDDGTQAWLKGASTTVPAHLRRLDTMPLAGYLKEIGYSDFARKLVKASNGSEVEVYSALAWLAAEWLEKGWNRTYRIKGGNELIAKTFATKLSPRSKVELLANVKGVISTDRQVKVTYVQRGDEKEIIADYCISTLPLDVLKKVNWAPGLSQAKRRASEEVPMQTVTRVNLQFSQRFWEAPPYHIKGLKVLHSDLKIERLWDMTGSEDQKTRTKKISEKGILTAYIQSQNAVEVGKKDEQKALVNYVLQEITKVFPEAKDTFIKGMSFLWHKQDWVGGGWAAFAPGQIDLYHATQTPEGRVFFAGDHTSLEPGWLQGAFHSVHRALGQMETLMSKDESKIAVY